MWDPCLKVGVGVIWGVALIPIGNCCFCWDLMSEWGLHFKCLTKVDEGSWRKNRNQTQAFKGLSMALIRFPMELIMNNSKLHWLQLEVWIWCLSEVKVEKEHLREEEKTDSCPQGVREVPQSSCDSLEGVFQIIQSCIGHNWKFWSNVWVRLRWRGRGQLAEKAKPDSGSQGVRGIAEAGTKCCQV